MNEATKAIVDGLDEEGVEAIILPAGEYVVITGGNFIKIYKTEIINKRFKYVAED